MSNTQEKIKRVIEKDFEYCKEKDLLEIFKFYHNYDYGLIMGAGYYENIDELGAWWNNEMNQKYIEEMQDRG